MFGFKDDHIRGKQGILYRLTTTVKEAIQAKKCFQNKKKRLTEVEEEDAYKRLFPCGDIFCMK